MSELRKLISEAVLGPRALLDTALPTGVDGSEILRFEMEDGMTPAEVISLAAATIGEANEMIFSRFGGVVGTTERIWSRYRKGTGDRSLTPEHSEFAEPNGRRADKIGHMLPRIDYKDATQWSRRYLERANREDLRDDLLEIRDAWYNRVTFDVFTRVFSRTEVPVGSSGYSPGWVIGSGGNLPYIPPSRGTHVFDSTIDHYFVTNSAFSAANWEAAIELMAKSLSWQGHTGRKVVFISEDNLATITAITNNKFARLLPPEFTFQPGQTANALTVSGELEGTPGEAVGYYLSNYGVIEVRSHDSIPAGYGWMTKSYGVNSPQNGLAVRTEPGRGFGLMVNPKVDDSLVPSLSHLAFEATHGVGVNDRTNGAVYQIAAAGTSWIEPQIYT